jgi:hypothetical protein
MENSEQICKFKFFDECHKHAPVLIPNRNVDKYGKSYTGDWDATVFPDALCPCGDFEPIEKENKLWKI